MPATIEIDVKWSEKFAIWPQKSTWSKKRIWLKKYWLGEIFHDAMGRPPIKDTSWKLVYTENEYLLMLLKQQQDDSPMFKSVRGH